MEKYRETVFSIPQLEQPLFVRAIDGRVFNYGLVTACKLDRDLITGQKFIRVKTTLFPDGIEVVQASDVFMAPIKR